MSLSIFLCTLLSIASSASLTFRVFDALVGALPHVRKADESWIVVLNKDLDSSALTRTWSLLQADGHQILHKWDSNKLNLRAFSMIPKVSHLWENENNETSSMGKNAERLWTLLLESLSIEKQTILQENIAWVERNMEFKMTTLQPNPVWNLDRIDQTLNPLDRRYGYLFKGSGVNVYVMDSGIRTTHQEFEGRAFFLYNAWDGGIDTQDCNGHGTHVAGIVGSKTYGVAKNVTLWNVKVLDCSGVGSSTTLLWGMTAVATYYSAPAILSLSLGGPQSPVIDSAATTLMKTYGVNLVVAAGNDNADACNVSPAHVDGVITVGASDEHDARSSYSNWGSCVKVFAPGDNIRSLSASSDTATVVYSGTSMAAPHASGIAAMLLSRNRSLSVTDVYRLIVYNSTLNILTNLGTGSPNRLLYQQYNEGYDASNVASDQSSFMNFLVHNWIALFLSIVGLIVASVMYNFYKNRQMQKKVLKDSYNYPFTSDYAHDPEVPLDYDKQTLGMSDEVMPTMEAQVNNFVEPGNLQSEPSQAGEEGRPQAGYLRI